MPADLLEHAVHLLRSEPGHCMGLEALHGRVVTDLRTAVPIGRFTAALTLRPDRFTILADGGRPADEGCGGSRDTAVCAAPAAAGSTPVVLLNAVATDPPTAAAAGRQNDRAAVRALNAAQEALADLMRCSPDGRMHDALGLGLEELQSVRRVVNRWPG